MIPKLSVIIPFHRIENQPYLDLCLNSLIKQEDIALEIIVLATEGVSPRVPDGVGLSQMMGVSTFAKKQNMGVKLSHPESKYVFMGSDDLIFCKNSLSSMVKTLDERGACFLNATSNCDNGWLYNLPLDYHGAPRERFMTIDKLTDVNALMEYQPSNKGLIFTRTNCFYGTMMDKRVYQHLGPLDENFIDGFEDSDYVLRGRKNRILAGVDLGAFIFHFGGRTSEFTVTEASKNSNYSRFVEKHGLAALESII